MTYLFCCCPDHLKTQRSESIQGHQWKECCREGTACHYNAVLNETIHFAVFKGLKTHHLDASPLSLWLRRMIFWTKKQVEILLERFYLFFAQGKKPIWVVAMSRKVQRVLPFSIPFSTVCSEDGEDFSSWSLGSMKKLKVLCPYRPPALLPDHTASLQLIYQWFPLCRLLRHSLERVVRTQHKIYFRIKLGFAWLNEDTGNCHLTLAATVFSSPWGIIDHISEAFNEHRGRKKSCQHTYCVGRDR